MNDYHCRSIEAPLWVIALMLVMLCAWTSCAAVHVQRISNALERAYPPPVEKPK